ncbi:MAG: D-alanyl-D-alanine carboxypeptidase [Oscillospiraceae bacterium]|nr:D-alanyl-D-alanine carboxypeptidase [Oscillospiraceae bacterium]
MKQFLCSLIAATALISFSCALNDAPENAARASILIHMDSGDVLYEKNADEPLLIASTTKLMTALVTVRHCDMTELVKVTSAHCAVEGSSVYLKPGETYSVESLLYGLLLSSGNDAAAALADHVGGSTAGFANLMNQEAAALGLRNTHFSNPHGLDAKDHYSSAADLAALMREVMRDDRLPTILASKTYTVGETTCVNHNKLLWNYPDCIGGKTGYTSAAGRTLVSCAERDGLRLICVTLSDPDDWVDHAALYDWGFANWEYRNVVSQDVLAQIPVIAGEAEHVGIIASETTNILTARDGATSAVLELPSFVYAPVQAGQSAGALVITTDNEFTLRVELSFAENVPLDEQERLTTWEKIKRAWYLANRYGGMGYYGLVYSDFTTGGTPYGGEAAEIYSENGRLLPP